jgi:hypothetical protein
MSVTEQLKLMKQPIIEKCIGEKSCSKIEPLVSDLTFKDGVPSPLCYCKVYAFPKAKWRNGICNMADHIVLEVKKDTKVRVGQQKQKKKL